MYKLDNDEQAILDSYESDEWESALALVEEIRRYRAYAAVQAETAGQDRIDLSGKDKASGRKDAS